MLQQQLRFEPWANFYVITSAAAAQLLGLLFVVITLAAEREGKGNAPKIRIYLTPNVIYFSSVLLISALLTIPGQTRLSAIICICLGGTIGLVYSGFLGVRRGPGSAFYQERADLFPYIVFPFAGYALMVAGGLLLSQRGPIGFDLIAAATLALLGIAIRNSWAIATTIVSSRG